MNKPLRLPTSDHMDWEAQCSVQVEVSNFRWRFEVELLLSIAVQCQAMNIQSEVLIEVDLAESVKEKVTCNLPI